MVVELPAKMLKARAGTSEPKTDQTKVLKLKSSMKATNSGAAMANMEKQQEKPMLNKHANDSSDGATLAPLCLCAIVPIMAITLTIMSGNAIAMLNKIKTNELQSCSICGA